MNINIGTDIVENKRFEKLVYITLENSDTIYNYDFLNRIYTKNEIEESRKRKNVIEYFASRFAAKEALVKASGTGFGNGINYFDIEILNDNNGKPYFKLYNKIEKVLNKAKIELSISHERKYSIAFVLIYK